MFQRDSRQRAHVFGTNCSCKGRHQAFKQNPFAPIVPTTPPIDFPTPPIGFPTPPIDFPTPPIGFPTPPIDFPNPPIVFPTPPIVFPIPPIDYPTPPIVEHIALARFTIKRSRKTPKGL